MDPREREKAESKFRNSAAILPLPSRGPRSSWMGIARDLALAVGAISLLTFIALFGHVPQLR